MPAYRFLALAVCLTACSEQGVSVYNTVPTVSILSPVDGEEYDEDESIELSGVVQDAQDGMIDLKVRWVSDDDGVLGEVEVDEDGNVGMLVDPLSIGGHVITLQALDSSGELGEMSVQIDIEQIQYRDPEDQDPPEDGAPSVSITSPNHDVSLASDEPLTLEGMALDSETDLDDLIVVWTSDLDGELDEGTADSDGYSAITVNLTEDTHVITMTVIDEAGQESSDTVVVDVLDPAEHDGDGDGWTENDGDCNDTDGFVSPEATEQCDDADNDCDGEINAQWRDGDEPNDDDGTDLGPVDGFLWSDSTRTVGGLTLHNRDDIDFYIWDAGDDYWDDVDIVVAVTGLPSDGEHELTLYLFQDDAWQAVSSDTHSDTLEVSAEGSVWSDDEDYWMVSIEALDWSESSCTVEYTLSIDS